MELGWPLPKRRELLREALEQKSEKTHPVPFQGEMRYFPIHEIPLGLPLYRLENGRTTGSQAEYLSAHPEVSADFFRADSESASAQKVQHRLLVELARGKKNLFKEFESKPQTEPIILTSLGYVVNGNRRLSTWRDLLESNKAKYDRFRNIKVVILPFVDEKEIDRVEAELQLKEDLKADYSWTSTALMMREKMQRHGYSEDDLTILYGKNKKQLVEFFDSLDYAIQYLESRDMPSKFSEVDGDKAYAFIQIARTRKKMKSSPAEKELFERAAFCITDEAGEGKRIYAEIPKISDYIDEVKDSLAAELDIEIEGVDRDTAACKISEAISDRQNFERARLVIRDAIEAAAYARKDKAKKDSAATLIHRAKVALLEASGSIDTRSTKSGVIEALNEIEDLVAVLRKWATDDEK